MKLRHLVMLLGILAISNCNHTSEVNLHFRTGNEYAKDGLYKEAINSYKKAAKLEPNNSAITRNSGIVYLKLGMYDQAAADLQSILSFYSNNYETNFYLAEALRNKGDVDNASYQYRKALELRPKDPQASKGLAWCLLEMNRLEHAAEVLSINNLSRDPQAIILKSRVLSAQNQYAEALASLRWIRAESTPHIAPYISAAIGDVFLKQALYQEAKAEHLQALKSQPLLYHSLIGLAKSERNLGNLAAAQKYAEQASRVQPQNPEPWKEIGIIAKSMKDDEKAKLALAEYQKRSNPKNGNRKQSKKDKFKNDRQIKM